MNLPAITSLDLALSYIAKRYGDNDGVFIPKEMSQIIKHFEKTLTEVDPNDVNRIVQKLINDKHVEKRDLRPKGKPYTNDYYLLTITY